MAGIFFLPHLSFNVLLILIIIIFFKLIISRQHELHRRAEAPFFLSDSYPIILPNFFAESKLVFYIFF